MTKEEIKEFWLQFDSLNDESNYGPDGLWIHAHRVGGFSRGGPAGSWVGFCGPTEALHDLLELFERAFLDLNNGTVYVPLEELE